MSFRDDPQRDDCRQGVSLRSRVDKMVHANIDDAYQLAKTIKHPWYRSQALAKVAEYSSKSFIKSILQESFDSAMNCHDQNRRVSVACWPLGIAIKKDLNGLASYFLEQCISQINQEMDPISKWCAASVVHTIKTDSDLLKSFYNTFVSATSEGHGWRIEREILVMLSDPEINKDKNYISYLVNRQLAIVNWKNENLKRKAT